MVGAGAVGAAVADLVARKLSSAVTILAGGERAERYLREGFVLNGARRDFALVSPADRSAPDLVIVAVKTYQLEQAVAEMRKQPGRSISVMRATRQGPGVSGCGASRSSSIPPV